VTRCRSPIKPYFLATGLGRSCDNRVSAQSSATKTKKIPQKRENTGTS